jgi:hypothetical protein
MKIILNPDVAMNLENLVHVVGHQEFSGVGFVNVVNGDVVVYDIEVLDVGSAGYTEIDAGDIMKLNRPDIGNIRLWFHRHPLEGWSGTDVTTITQTPLGGIPEIIKWSASIVRTPTHWIGRMDNHLKKTMQVVEVVPNISPSLTLNARALLGDYYRREEELTVSRYPFWTRQLDSFEDYNPKQLSYLPSAASTTAGIPGIKEIDGPNYDDPDDWIGVEYIDDGSWFDDDAHAAELAMRYEQERKKKNKPKIFTSGGRPW